MIERRRVVIVGAGVVGLSIGISLLDSNNNLQVTVLDKEAELGTHASGRNSGVLHAGFYYSPDSLKAKFCRDGNFELKSLCRKYEIPVLPTGKVVVARDQSENERLEILYRRGVSNGVELELLEAGNLKAIEPLAITHERFLWSPNTAVSDPRAVIKALREEFVIRGGKIELNERVKLIQKSGEFSLPGYKSELVINAAGAQADRLARKVGLAKQYAMVPFMGVYRSIPSEKLPLQRLVYPVPHPINPFLGVHFTLTLDGKVKIGPTAIPILGREQYSTLRGFSLADSLQALKASYGLVKGKAHDFSEILRSELPKLRQKNLISESATLVPSARETNGWAKRPPGIRSQLVNMKSGMLEQDFIVEVAGNSVHVLNAVSPGWTSALPFGRWVANEKILPIL
jgi:L-2-hydroxyglutarate oxidase LhgO